VNTNAACTVGTAWQCGLTHYCKNDNTCAARTSTVDAVCVSTGYKQSNGNCAASMACTTDKCKPDIISGDQCQSETGFFFKSTDASAKNLYLSQCGTGLFCNPKTYTCQTLPTITKGSNDCSTTTGSSGMCSEFDVCRKDKTCVAPADTKTDSCIFKHHNILGNGGCSLDFKCTTDATDSQKHTCVEASKKDVACSSDTDCEYGLYCDTINAKCADGASDKTLCAYKSGDLINTQGCKSATANCNPYGSFTNRCIPQATTVLGAIP